MSMKERTIYAFGDSIVYGHTMPEKSFMRMIAEENGYHLKMFAVNGATIIKSDNDIQTQVEAAPVLLPDAIVLDGYTNDAYPPTMTMLGEIQPQECYEFNESTFCGAFEKLLSTIKHKWPDIPILFVTIHKSGSRDWEVQCKLRDLALQMCLKWKVKVVDIFHNCNLDTRDEEQMRELIIDGGGSHPNEQCCRKYYCPQVKTALENSWILK